MTSEAGAADELSALVIGAIDTIGPILLAAILGSALTFWVQTRLTNRRRVEAERRMAFVNLVRVSEIVAIRVALEKALPSLKERLSSTAQAQWELFFPPDESYDWMHASSAFLFLMLRDHRDKAELHNLTSVIERNMDSITESLDFHLSPQALSQLPAEVVLAYSHFSIAASHVVASFRIFSTASKSPTDLPLPSPVIYSFLKSAQSLFQHADVLRQQLMLEGGCTREKADAILQEQSQRRAQMGNAILENESKLAEAESRIAEHIRRVEEQKMAARGASTETQEAAKGNDENGAK